MTDEALRAIVEEQARAHVAGDAAAFASRMAPAALVSLAGTAGQSRGITLRRFELLDVRENGDTGASEVRYDGAGTYVLRQRWERTASGWTAVAAERPVESIRRPWWRRIFGRGGGAPERQELS